MKFLKKILESIKKIFVRKEEVKALEMPKTIEYQDKREEEFLRSIRVQPQVKTKPIETLICYGDGLGIQKKITY